MKKDWKKELARDLLALGSIPFYFIVIIRAVIGEYSLFIYQMLIALIILFILSKIIKDSNQHLARGFIIFMFTSVFYKEALFTVFTLLIFILMIISSNYLKIKKNTVVRGVLLGVISAGLSYYLSPLI